MQLTILKKWICAIPTSMFTRHDSSALLRNMLKSFADTFVTPSRFENGEAEKAFLQDYGNRFAQFRRAALALGLIFWSAFLWWDFLQDGTNAMPFSEMALERVLLFRGLGIVGLIATCCASLSARFVNDSMAHIVILTGVLWTWTCLIGMIVVVPSPVDYINYFVGLYLVLIFHFGFFHLRARPVLITTVFLSLMILGAQFANYFGLPIELLRPEHFKPGIFYYAAVCIVGFGVCVKFERYARQQYSHEQQLSISNEQLRRQNETIAIEQESNFVRVQALIQLKEEQRTMAVQASENKSQFLASAAHDLRQPMFGLNLSLEAMRHALNNKDWVETERLLELSRQSAKTMGTSFDAVLDLSKLESGFISPKITEFDVLKLVEEVVAEFRQFALSKDLALRVYATNKALLNVNSDRMMLGRILKNLVSNGIKYSNPRREDTRVVLIGVVCLPTHARIDIIDNGIGIDSSQWNRIFEPFVQLDNPERDREKGLGLGLSIVNAMISILDEHRLVFKSKLNKGTRFSIEVPKGKCDPHLRDSPLSVESSPTLVPVAGLYVLVVDNDVLVRSAIGEVFAQWGMLVDSVGNVKELTKLFDDMERMPDLVITNYRLSEAEGAHDVIRIVRSQCQRESSATRIPILMVTGESDVTRLGVTGVDVVLAKPVHPDVLRTAISSLVAMSQTGQLST